MYDGGFRNSDPLIALSSLCLERHNGHPLKRLRNESWTSRENERENKWEMDQQFGFVSLSQRAQLPKQQMVLSLYTRVFGGRVHSLFVWSPSPHLCGVSSKMGLFRGWVSTKQAGATSSGGAARGSRGNSALEPTQRGVKSSRHSLLRRCSDSQAAG